MNLTAKIRVLSRRAALLGWGSAHGRPAALLLLGILACSPPARPGVPPRHVLLITVDTLRPDHLSGYLYPRLTSWLPSTEEERSAGSALAIDDLIDQGVTFANAFAPRGQTFPSIATLMTGRAPEEHGALNNGDLLVEGAVTLAESFRAAGFATAAFTANRLLVPISGIAQGFDTFECVDSDDRDVSVVQAAWSWVQEVERGGDPPRFLWLHLMGPHLPYAPQPFQGQDFSTLFADPGYDGAADGSREFLDGVYTSGGQLTGLDIEQVVALYDGEVARVSKVLNAFLVLYAGVFSEGEPRRLEDTALVFASDHGEELYQHNFYWGHSKSVYSSVLQVPLFMRHPASLTGARVFSEIVELQDVMPTLLEWFELESPEGVRGRSLLGLVDTYDGGSWEERPAFGDWRGRIFSVRTPQWRFVWNPDEVEPEEEPEGAYHVPQRALFDVREDPLELHDLSAQHPEVVAELEAAILAWQADLSRSSASVRVEDPEFLQSLAELGYTGDGE